MSCPEHLNGRQGDVNDERHESGNQGAAKPIAKSWQEGKRADSGRDGCVDRIQPLACGRLLRPIICPLLRVMLERMDAFAIKMSDNGVNAELNKARQGHDNAI